MSDADKAYAAALTKIEKVKALGKTNLFLDIKQFRALRRTPLK
jgi:hypothetical protein